MKIKMDDFLRANQALSYIQDSRFERLYVVGVTRYLDGYKVTTSDANDFLSYTYYVMLGKDIVITTSNIVSGKTDKYIVRHQTMASTNKPVIVVYLNNEVLYVLNNDNTRIYENEQVRKLSKNNY